MTAATAEAPATETSLPPVAPAPESSEQDGDEDTPDGALVGPELLAKVKALGECSKSDLVRACGYVSTKKDGTERLNFTAFYEAMLAAKGTVFGPATTTESRRGRKLSGRTRVQFNGNLLVGRAYTAQLGLVPGDEFEIKLARSGSITLVPTGNNIPVPAVGDQAAA